MVFVTLRHVLRVNGADAVTEEQDIVYRGASKGEPAKAPQPEMRAAEQERAFAPDATMLFRFSALTFNAHRIHYDLDYAKNEEEYPGLVVHGPYIATALMDHAIRTSPGAVFKSFQFRAQRPLFMGDAATLCRAGNELWCRNSAGEATMSARID
jgi:3-methylfumaryl-CoA hydratase